MSKVLRGRDTVIKFVSATGLDDFSVEQFKEWKDEEISFEVEELKFSLLGTDRVLTDSVLGAATFSGTMILVSAKELNSVLQLIRTKSNSGSQRLSTAVNIATTITDDSGQSAIITLKDVSFGTIPLNIGSNKDALELKIKATASEWTSELSS